MNRDLRILIGAILTLSTAACLPIRITYLDSPTLDGTYRAADGTPMRGVPVLVSSGYSDSTCASPAARTVTDSSGAFHLPQTKHTEKFIILLPFDRFTSYHLCLTSRDTLRAAYRASAIGTAMPSQPLECFEWMSGAEARVTCAEEGGWAVVSGGRWAADSAAGYYRLVTNIDPKNGSRLFVLAQWIAGPRGRPTGPIIETVDLNAETKLHSLAKPELVADGTRWQVHLKGSTRPDAPLVHDVVFELGAPGEVRLVRDECKTNALRDVWLAQRTCK